MTPRRPLATLFTIAAAALLAGCSIQTYAVNKLGDALSESGTTFAADDDPELIAGALPFSLKLIESLLAETPNHRGLLLAASSGFTQYAFAFVQQQADRVEDDDYDEAERLRTRARKLYLRGREYGLRGLETRHRGVREALNDDPLAAVATMTRDDVPLLYWTAAAWAAAISLSKDDPDLLAQQPAVEAMFDRALALDETWQAGAIHSFLIAYEPVRPGGGDGFARARQHFDRAVALSAGQLVSPYVSLAENVAVPTENLDEFKSLLERALAIDPDARPEWRLENTIMQQRARWLSSRIEKLFLVELEGEEEETEPEPQPPREIQP